jgi:putative chitinase
MLTVDFLAKPDLATDRKLASAILYTGVQRGWFTGKRLADYRTSDGSVSLDGVRFTA